MPEPVVHQLEVVQIDEQHAERRVAALRALDQLRETVGEQHAVGEPRQRVELRKKGEPALGIDALQAGGKQGRRGAQEAELLRPVGIFALRQRAKSAAHRVVAAHRDHRRAAESERPGERQRAARPDERLAAGQRHFHRVARPARHQPAAAPCPDGADAGAQYQLAGLRAGLDVDHRVRAQALDHRLDGLVDQLLRLALVERRLAEAGEARLVAQVGRLALIGGHALGQVARIDDQDRPLGRVVDGAANFHREGAAVLAPVEGGRGVGALVARDQVLPLALQNLAGPVNANLAGAAVEQLLARVAEVAARAFVEVDEAALPHVDQQHHVGRGVERGTEALQRGVGLPAAHRALADREAQAIGRARSGLFRRRCGGPQGRGGVHSPRLAGATHARPRPYKNWHVTKGVTALGDQGMTPVSRR